MGKNWGLPYPSATFLPVAFKPNATLSALQAKIDKWVAQWEADAQAMLYQRSPNRVPVLFIPELSWLLQAGVTPADSDQEARQKLVSAIPSHQAHGTMLYDVGPKVQGITGIYPTIFSSLNGDWWVLSGGNPYPTNAYWSVLGGGATDPLATGMVLAGSGDDAIMGTVVQMDLGTSTLTPTQVAQVVAAITNSVPCYFRVFLGYQQPAGVFNVYAGGQIN